ncbi:MAG TPA: FeoB small GTPase domain-containing protein, partial [Gammaproteobacteria bacterium]|nr:FeoB small GTPase domain-containing protein [Gammaproteobacteria bacterium]
MEKLALIGNPNSGKTTLFNVLTGANQKVGNWPGVTVEKKFGHFELDDLAIELVDLPGIYSLEQEYQGIDEKIAQDYLQGSAIDLVINIIDATNLERGLVLTQQLMEKQLPLVIVLNMLDVAEQQGITLKPEALSERLGVPVVPIVASRKQGVSELESCLKRCLQNPTRVPEQLEETSDDVTEDPILKRYYRSQSLVSGVVQVAPTHHGMSERIDNVVLIRWLGIPF